MRNLMQLSPLALILLLPLILPSLGYAENVCFKCHKQQLFKNTFTHKPVADDNCGSCHNPHVARYKNLLQQNVAALCFSCHEKAGREFNQGIVHSPVKKGDCTACHAPHASNDRGLLNKRLADSCFSCHTATPKQFEHTHTPYAKGACTACHRPHQADNGYLLIDNTDKLCLTCHQQATLQRGHANFPKQPAQCLSCHNPHGSKRKGLIRNEMHKPFAEGCKGCHGKEQEGAATVCLECHDDVKQQMYTTHSHFTAPGKGNGCLECHSPHAGDTTNLLISEQRILCRKCHEETFHRKESSPYPHPDAATCSNCHDIHGSNNAGMLKGDGNDVCAGCHKDQGQFTHPVGAKIRDPRTDQAVTCVSCHYPMGTEYKYQLKRNGQKELCILCHRAY